MTGMIVHDLLSMAVTLSSVAAGDGDPTTAPQENNFGSGSGDSNTIVLALISAATTIIGGLILAYATIRSSRSRRSTKEEDDQGNGTPGTPDYEFRKLLKRFAALELFLGLRGYNPEKIKTGMETDHEARA